MPTLTDYDIAQLLDERFRRLRLTTLPNLAAGRAWNMADDRLFVKIERAAVGPDRGLSLVQKYQHRRDVELDQRGLLRCYPVHWNGQHPGKTWLIDRTAPVRALLRQGVDFARSRRYR